VDRLRRIVVGVDIDPDGKAPSPGSLRAVEQACLLARRTGASVRVMHSTWRDEEAERPPDPRDALEALRDERARRGDAIEVSVVEGRPWLELIRAVLRGEADLVVVGKRNRAGDDERRLGSVAVKLLRKCPVPVWVVHPEREPVAERVLAATDLTAVGDRALEYAAWIADASGAALHVLHAYQVPLELQLEGGVSEQRYVEGLRALERDARAHIEQTLARTRFRGPVELHVGRDAPARAIRHAAQRLRPDLLVMGTLSRTGVAGLLVGNTAERMLDRVECSLLTIKPEGFVSPVRLEDGPPAGA
jgi:nucleotide-binding universal stress UspA family protein